MNKRNELSEQQAVIEWCEWHLGRYPELKSIYHITNEGKRSIAGGAQLKKSRTEKRCARSVPALCTRRISRPLHRNEKGQQQQAYRESEKVD